MEIVRVPTTEPLADIGAGNEVLIVAPEELLRCAMKAILAPKVSKNIGERISRYIIYLPFVGSATRRSNIYKGRVAIKVMYHHGPIRNSKPIDFIMFTQIYGDVNLKHQWIDDIEVWDRIPAKYR